MAKNNTTLQPYSLTGELELNTNKGEIHSFEGFIKNNGIIKNSALSSVHLKQTPNYYPIYVGSDGNRWSIRDGYLYKNDDRVNDNRYLNGYGIENSERVVYSSGNVKCLFNKNDLIVKIGSISATILSTSKNAAIAFIPLNLNNKYFCITKPDVYGRPAEGYLIEFTGNSITFNLIVTFGLEEIDVKDIEFGLIKTVSSNDNLYGISFYPKNGMNINPLYKENAPISFIMSYTGGVFNFLKWNDNSKIDGSNVLFNNTGGFPGGYDVEGTYSSLDLTYDGSVIRFYAWEDTDTHSKVMLRYNNVADVDRNTFFSSICAVYNSSTHNFSFMTVQEYLRNVWGKTFSYYGNSGGTQFTLNNAPQEPVVIVYNTSTITVSIHYDPTNTNSHVWCTDGTRNDNKVPYVRAMCYGPRFLKSPGVPTAFDDSPVTNPGENTRPSFFFEYLIDSFDVTNFPNNITFNFHIDYGNGYSDSAVKTMAWVSPGIARSPNTRYHHFHGFYKELFLCGVTQATNTERYLTGCYSTTGDAYLNCGVEKVDKDTDLVPDDLWTKDGGNYIRDELRWKLSTAFCSTKDVIQVGTFFVMLDKGFIRAIATFSGNLLTAVTTINEDVMPVIDPETNEIWVKTSTNEWKHIYQTAPYIVFIDDSGWILINSDVARNAYNYKKDIFSNWTTGYAGVVKNGAAMPLSTLWTTSFLLNKDKDTRLSIASSFNSHYNDSTEPNLPPFLSYQSTPIFLFLQGGTLRSLPFINTDARPDLWENIDVSSHDNPDYRWTFDSINSGDVNTYLQTLYYVPQKNYLGIPLPASFQEFYNRRVATKIDDVFYFLQKNLNNDILYCYELTSGYSGIRDVFVLQGSVYTIYKNYICSVDFAAGTMPSELINIFDMIFIGADCYQAYFFSPKTRTIYAFNGSLTFQKVKECTAITVFKSFFSLQSLNLIMWSVSSDSGELLLIIKDGLMTRIEIDVNKIIASNIEDSFILQSNNRVYELSLFGDSESKTKLNVESMWMGISNKNSTVDCVYFRFLAAEKVGGKITVIWKSLINNQTSTEKKEFTVTSQMFNKDTDNFLIRFQPKNQFGKMFKFEIVSDYDLTEIDVSYIQETSVVTPEKLSI